MAKYAKKVVEQAKAWLGKKESNGSHKAIIDIYNDHKPLPGGYKVKYTDSWCATFVSAVAIKLGYEDIIPIECSCQRMIELFKKAGIWVEDENRTPQPGDIIFYDWEDKGTGDNQGWSDHVGIVEKVSGGKITVIEGNYSETVKRRNIAVNGKFIRGFGIPNYDKENATQGKNEPVKIVNKTATAEEYNLTAFVKEVQKAIGAKVDGIAGAETIGKTITVSAKTNRLHAVVKPLQKRLNALGFNCGTVDGIAGAKFTAAVQAYQKANGCTSDGIITARNKTWKKLLGIL